jgi:hypothetical protein
MLPKSVFYPVEGKAGPLRPPGDRVHPQEKRNKFKKIENQYNFSKTIFHERCLEKLLINIM